MSHGHLSNMHCENGSAILDTGTSLLAVPGPVITQIQDMLDDVGCSDISKLPNLVFDMGGVTVSLPPDSYVGEAIGEVPSYLQGFVAQERVRHGDQVQRRH